ncbi:MAG: hypothetical protein CMB80_27695 [Flammeovirgaceae bacterium]|nr:hypothetical protein [Flammeovirgaceae bacterium]|tara:strand:+ start:364 stop:666 length:303 start_codon:yes stop_codon:yes gene_type:complete
MQKMTFKDYYSHYLTLHQHPVNRMLHVLGNLATIFYIIGCVTTDNFFFLVFSPLIVYPFAWSGHAFFEKNKPAAFSKPIWAKCCDWIMIKDMLCNKIGKR